MKLVPENPTSEMLQAANKAGLGTYAAIKTWAVMVLAAQTKHSKLSEDWLEQADAIEKSGDKSAAFAMRYCAKSLTAESLDNAIATQGHDMGVV